jgi:signal transduction histidine kinase
VRADRAARAARLRVCGAATATVAALLVIVTVGVVHSQRQQLTEAVEDFAELRLADLLPRIEAGEIEDPIESLGDQQDVFSQVVVGGEVRSSTTNVAGLMPLFESGFEPGVEPGVEPGCDPTFSTEQLEALDNSTFRVLHRCVAVAGEPGVVHVGVNLDDVEESVAALRQSLLIAVPLLLLLLATMLWWLVGRLLGRVIAAAEREQRFVGDAAHELRSPLARMRAALEVDGADAVATVLSDTVSMGKLVDDLLTLARLDAARTSRRAPVDLDDLVLDCVEALRVERELQWDLRDVSGAQVIGDADQLRRVVLNLLDNARRYATTTISIALSERGGSVVLRVADDGPGIPVDQRARVFERFARVDESRTTSTGGTGLGLAIAREIVQRHRGSIAIDSAYLGGAQIIVTLPTAPDR